MVMEIEATVRILMSSPTTNNGLVHILRNMHEAVTHARSVRDTHAFVIVIQKLVEGLLEGVSAPGSEPQYLQRFRECIIHLLKMFQEQPTFGPHGTNVIVTK